jgi:transcriptional regulator with XRE-family HTH domain
MLMDIRETRRSLGLSQAELAERLGLHQATISRFESGKLPIDERTTLAIDALVLRSSKPRRRTAEARAV